MVEIFLAPPGALPTGGTRGAEISTAQTDFIIFSFIYIFIHFALIAMCLTLVIKDSKECFIHEVL